MPYWHERFVSSRRGLGRQGNVLGGRQRDAYLGETLTSGRLDVNAMASSFNGRNVIEGQLGRVLENGIVAGRNDEGQPATIRHGHDLGKGGRYGRGNIFMSNKVTSGQWRY